MKWLALILLLALLTPTFLRAEETRIHWIETPTHRIKVKLVDGEEIGRWSFPRKAPTTSATSLTEPPPKNLTPVFRWEETSAAMIKTATVKGHEVRRWTFPKKPCKKGAEESGQKPAPPSTSPPPLSIEEILLAAQHARGTGDLEGAIGSYRLALKQLDRPETDPLELCDLLRTLGGTLVEKSGYREAEPLFLRTLEIYRMSGVANSPQAADLHVQLARVYGAERQYDQAEGELLDALNVRESFHGPSHPSVANILYLLGLLSHEQGDLKKAEALYLKALSTFQSSDSLNHKASFLAHRYYARLLREENRLYEARSYERRAKELASPPPELDPYR
jgi:tetratricopeptide (TPR) repeat protein